MMSDMLLNAEGSGDIEREPLAETQPQHRIKQAQQSSGACTLNSQEDGLA